MQRRMIEAKTGSGEERMSEKVVTSKTLSVGYELTLNQELEILHGNFECRKWAAQSWTQTGP